MTHRLLPHPRLTLFVAVIWLGLANEISVGALVMGLVLGLVLPVLTGPFWPDAPRLRAPLKILDYFRVVAWDIVLANLQVARLILFVPADRLRSTFVTIPLDLRTPEGQRERLIDEVTRTIRLTGSTPANLYVISYRHPEPDQARKVVYVVGPDKRVAVRPVELGPVSDGLRVVDKGLTAGDRIVIRGLLRVQPGAVVDPQPGSIAPVGPTTEKK